jgi:hypothetical protein
MNPSDAVTIITMETALRSLSALTLNAGAPLR